MDTTEVWTKTQKTKDVSTEKLTDTDLEWVQEFIGIFLYYARTIDTTMVTAVNSTAASTRSSTIKDIRRRINHFLDYAATHPNASIS